MSSILEGLGVSAPDGIPAPDGGTGTNPSPSPDSGTPSADPFADLVNDPQAKKPLLVLKAIATGKLPGVLVPKDAPSIKSNIKPNDITSLGVGIYRPHQPDLALVLFNPEQVSSPELESLDKSGKLANSLPSITDFLGNGSAAGVAGNEAPVTPVGSEPSTPPVSVPVLPKPTLSADASRSMAVTRSENLTGSEPSKRRIPGGGTVLNGLLNRPV